MREKARYSEPCTRCGTCCSLEVCSWGDMAYLGAGPPCPGLRYTPEGAAECELVTLERLVIEGKGTIEKTLGIGCGCSNPDPETTREEVEAHNRRSAMKMFGDGDKKSVGEGGER